MTRSIAFVGAGPTTIYALCAFLNEAVRPAAVTIFEEQPRAGLGTPYRLGWNDPAMLSNIASIIYCLSIPFILGRHPFIQGITSSNEMGQIVGADLARNAGPATAAEPMELVVAEV